MSSRTVSQQIVDSGVIAIIRGVEGDTALDVVEAVSEGEIKTVEITVDTPGVLGMIRQVTDELGDNISIGAGTVFDPETARIALLAGAEFIVTPNLNRDVIKACNRYGAPVVPGVMTLIEALTAIEVGAEFCKLFPAASLGPDHIQAINGPLSQVPLIPTGGISLENAGVFFEADAVAVGIGSALIDREAIKANEYDDLTDKAAQFSKLTAEHR